MKHIIFALVLLLGCNGCSILKLKADLDEAAQTAGIIGKVESSGVESGPILMAIFKDGPKGKILRDYRVFVRSSYFGFLVPFGAYDIAGFQDINGNGKYEIGEPAAIIHAERKRNSRGKDIVLKLDREFKPDEKKIAEFEKATWQIEKTLPLSFGQVADFSNPIFSEEFGSMGFWEPLRFLKEAGVGIYFIEEYSSKKTPVLFVSGASGNPMGWRSFMESVDRRKYQPWFFLYPSGERIETSADALAESIKELRTIYGFTKINIVAHSMGGLVSYRAIQIMREKNRGNGVNVFISISTPFAGHELAASGVKLSPAVVPCWIDMDPQSGFIKNLFDKKIPCDHHLWFSYAGSSITIGENSDGTVPLSSQLRKEAQQNAAEVFGFNEDHSSILKSKEVIQHLNRVMDAYQ